MRKTSFFDPVDRLNSDFKPDFQVSGRREYERILEPPMESYEISRFILNNFVGWEEMSQASEKVMTRKYSGRWISQQCSESEIIPKKFQLLLYHTLLPEVYFISRIFILHLTMKETFPLDDKIIEIIKPMYPGMWPAEFGYFKDRTGLRWKDLAEESERLFSKRYGESTFSKLRSSNAYTIPFKFQALLYRFMLDSDYYQCRREFWETTELGYLPDISDGVDVKYV